MAIEIKLFRNREHPWTGAAGWDFLHIHAGTEEERDQAVAAAEKKFWAAWIVGYIGGEPGSIEAKRPAAVMYKPVGATAPWGDNPEVVCQDS